MNITITISRIERKPEFPGQLVILTNGNAGLGVKTARRASADGKLISEAVLYSTEARCAIGEVSHVDDVAHIGRW